MGTTRGSSGAKFGPPPFLSARFIPKGKLMSLVSSRQGPCLLFAHHCPVLWVHPQCCFVPVYVELTFPRPIPGAKHETWAVASQQTNSGAVKMLCCDFNVAGGGCLFQREREGGVCVSQTAICFCSKWRRQKCEQYYWTRSRGVMACFCCAVALRHTLS